MNHILFRPWPRDSFFCAQVSDKMRCSANQRRDVFSDKRSLATGRVSEWSVLSDEVQVVRWSTVIILFYLRMNSRQGTELCFPYCVFRQPVCVCCGC